MSQARLCALASGFSGGIGGTFDEGTCGALTGALIALGFLEDDEIYGVKMSIRELASKIKLKKYDDFPVTCDASEPRSIAELREYGIKATRAKKGPGSVEFGENWLDDLEAIVIDSKRTPNTAREFENIDYQTDRDGNTISKLEDKDNHSIDATRYALENEMKVKNNIQVFK